MIKYKLIRGRDYSKYYKVEKDENGKPYLINSDKYISVSHQGNWTLIAISDSPVVIDVEKIKKYKESLPKYLGLNNENSKMPKYLELNNVGNKMVKYLNNGNRKIFQCFGLNNREIFQCFGLNKGKKISKYALFKEWTRREAYIKKNNLKLSQIGLLNGKMDGKFKTFLVFPYVVSVSY